jgi:hypothetical protein
MSARAPRPCCVRWTAWLLVLGLIAAAAPAHADEGRVAELTAQLAPARSEKERIAAVTALGRLGDKRTLRPLVAALRDKSPTVRAVAALGLGRLGHRAALPALRDAGNDRDALVRKRAQEAVAAISQANGIAREAGAAPVGKAGFGNQPRALAARPELYVIVKSASDDSPIAGPATPAVKSTRKLHADIARAAMTGELAANALVTSVAKEAKRFGLDCRVIDVIITKLETRTVGAYIEVEAQLRLAISDDRGKMLSFLTGGARVQVRKASYNVAYLPQLRRDAIDNAVKGLFDKLLAHLRRGAGA